MLTQKSRRGGDDTEVTTGGDDTEVTTGGDDRSLPSPRWNLVDIDGGAGIDASSVWDSLDTSSSVADAGHDWEQVEPEVEPPHQEDWQDSGDSDTASGFGWHGRYGW